MNFDELHRITRSYRRFTEEKIEKSAILAMIDAARTGSCAGNMQRLRYYLVLSEEKKRMVMQGVKWGMYLPQNEREIMAKEKPYSFIVIAAEGEEVSTNVLIDAGIAACNIAHSGMERGIATCILASFKNDEMKEALELDGEEVILIVALGKASHKSYVEDFSGSVKYYLDENRDFHVPKRKMADVFKEI